jgi:hypothetical protein
MPESPSLGSRTVLSLASSNGGQSNISTLLLRASDCLEFILQGEAKLQLAIILLDNFQSYNLSHLVLSFWRWSFFLFREEMGGEFSAFTR